MNIWALILPLILPLLQKFLEALLGVKGRKDVPPRQRDQLDQAMATIAMIHKEGGKRGLAAE